MEIMIILLLLQTSGVVLIFLSFIEQIHIKVDLCKTQSNESASRISGVFSDIEARICVTVEGRQSNHRL